MKEYSFAIVGTAGRKDDLAKLNMDKFTRMVGLTDSILTSCFNPQYYGLSTIVSGGSAWADHIAVRYFLYSGLKFKLKLYLPDYFVKGQFQDTGSRDWKTNPGGTLNYYHKLFKDKTGIDSLGEIEKAIEKGAEVLVEPGLFQRNTKVAESDILIALTFGKEGTVKPGGTADTVGKYLDRIKRQNLPNFSYHIDLNQMSTHHPAHV